MVPVLLFGPFIIYVFFYVFLPASNMWIFSWLCVLLIILAVADVDTVGKTTPYPKFTKKYDGKEMLKGQKPSNGFPLDEEETHLTEMAAVAEPTTSPSLSATAEPTTDPSTSATTSLFPFESFSLDTTRFFLNCCHCCSFVTGEKGEPGKMGKQGTRKCPTECLQSGGLRVKN